MLVGVGRFGRTALEQESGQDDIGRHLQELAFPIFEQGRQEQGIGEEGEGGDRILAMLGELGIVVRDPGQPLADQAGGEQQHQDDGQSVVLENLGHVSSGGLDSTGVNARARQRIARPSGDPNKC